MNKNNEEDENRLIAERRAKLLTIRENKKVAFPNTVSYTHLTLPTIYSV